MKFDLLDCQHPLAPELPGAPTRSETELASVVNSIAALWPTLSQRQIARELGVRPGVVSGLVGRARRNGDERFPRRPNPNPRPRKLKPADERVGNGKHANEVAAATFDLYGLVAPPLEPCGPLTLVELRAGACKWPLNSPPKGGEFLFLRPASVGRLLL